MLNNLEVGESLRWKKFPILDCGFCTLVDWMGDDSSVVQAARISYGEGTKKTSDDRTLIRFLYRHGHMTPFEMAEIKILVRVPMDCWRQWIRHRTANVNEYSTRYSEAIDVCQQTPLDGWRLQAMGNRQGSGGAIVPLGESTGVAENLCLEEKEFQERARQVYEHRLGCGVAREQARKDLPLSTCTEAYWKCDLRNIFNFLSLRMDSHAQQEIRAYADVIGREIIAPLFPICWEAFEDYDYRRSALLLTRLEVEVLRRILEGSGPVDLTRFNQAMGSPTGWPCVGIAPCRERDECLAKLRSLGAVKDD